MAGVKGKGGPPPKRSTQRRRRNKESKPDSVSAQAVAVEQPRADSKWHPAAKRWYASLAESGQAQFFEPSDWQAAQFIAGEMSDYLRSKRKSAMMFSHLWSAMGELLTTEASRRRVRMEIERAKVEDAGAEDAKVVRLDAIRARAAG
jgi:hypothetical protein